MRQLHQAMPLRAAYNEAAAAYNREIALFPAWLLAKACGFAPVGSLSRMTEPR